MLRKRLFSASGILVCFFVAATSIPLSAQSGFLPLELKHQDRILFLGSSLFENELAEGYLEFALASRWPDRDLTFRNLGWTGDNVFAEARSTFTTPPTPYQQLFQQIRSTKPNLVLIAYGGIESQKGEKGLSEFTRGLEIIIDSIDALGAQTILISTIPVKLAGNEENTVIQNKNLKLYTDAIASVASKRKKRFSDIYTPIAQSTGNLYRDNGIHLNADGYYYLAQVLERSFGWPDRATKITVNVSKPAASAEPPARMISEKNGKITFRLEEPLLPLPVTASGQPSPETSVSIRVNGLKKGSYTLTENGRQLLTASASEWAGGITLDHGISQVQAERVCEYIVKKNDLFFQQYRPLNRTYILGFRAYEQGRHKQGLEDLNFIITWLEGQINLHRKPLVKTYELVPLK